MKIFRVAVFVIALFMAHVAYAQSDQVCISQEAANKCAENVDKIKALEDALRERDKIIEELRIKFATEAQRATDNEATVIRLTVLLDTTLKAFTKPKKYGIIVF